MSHDPELEQPALTFPGNIFLVGLMGAGKTSVGRLLAKHFNKQFLDCDLEIERRTGVKIPVIFDIEGEDGFRTRESAMLHELAGMREIVLATGGGAVVREENRRVLKQNGTVVYLRASLDDLWQRTRHDRNRPLLQNGDPRLKLEQLFKQRDPCIRRSRRWSWKLETKVFAILLTDLSSIYLIITSFLWARKMEWMDVQKLDCWDLWACTHSRSR